MTQRPPPSTQQCHQQIILSCLDVVGQWCHRGLVGGRAGEHWTKGLIHSHLLLCLLSLPHSLVCRTRGHRAPVFRNFCPPSPTLLCVSCTSLTKATSFNGLLHGLPPLVYTRELGCLMVSLWPCAGDGREPTPSAGSGSARSTSEL